jgi:hypothetical protein
MVDKTVYFCYAYLLLGGFVKKGVIIAAAIFWPLMAAVFCAAWGVQTLKVEYGVGELDGRFGYSPSPARAEPALWVLRPVDFRGKAYRKGYEDGRDWCQAPNHRCIEYPTSSDESP